MNLHGERYQSRHKSHLRFLPNPFRKMDLCSSVGQRFHSYFCQDHPLSRLWRKKNNERKGKQVKPVQSVRSHRKLTQTSENHSSSEWTHQERHFSGCDTTAVLVGGLVKILSAWDLQRRKEDNAALRDHPQKSNCLLTERTTAKFLPPIQRQRQLSLDKAMGTGGTSVLKIPCLDQEGRRFQKDHRNSYRPTGHQQDRLRRGYWNQPKKLPATKGVWSSAKTKIDYIECSPIHSVISIC